MVRQLERHEVQDLHEGDTLEHDVHALEQPPLTVPEEWMREHGTIAPERRRPIRWMRWLAFLGVLAAGAGVAVIATLGDGGETAAGPVTVRAPQIRTVDRWELGLSPPVMSVVQRTVDNWEVGLVPPVVLMTPTHYEVAQPAVEGDWDHLFVVPAVAEPIVAQIPEGQWISPAPVFHTPDYLDHVAPDLAVTTPVFHTPDYLDHVAPDVAVTTPVFHTPDYLDHVAPDVAVTTPVFHTPDYLDHVAPDVG